MPCESMQRASFSQALVEVQNELGKLKPQNPTQKWFEDYLNSLRALGLNSTSYYPYLRIGTVSTTSTPTILSPEQEARAKELEAEAKDLQDRIAKIDKREKLHSHIRDVEGNIIVKWFKTPEEKTQFDATYPQVLAVEQARDLVRPKEKQSKIVKEAVPE